MIAPREILAPIPIGNHWGLGLLAVTPFGLYPVMLYEFTGKEDLPEVMERLSGHIQKLYDNWDAITKDMGREEKADIPKVFLDWDNETPDETKSY